MMWVVLIFAGCVLALILLVVVFAVIARVMNRPCGRTGRFGGSRDD